MNQERNFQREVRKKNRGSLTLEASIVLVMFMVAYMAILSIINMYRAQVLIQNAANQTAQEIAQYTYILKKAGLAEVGKDASENADRFMDDTQKTLGTVFAFFTATSDGLEEGKAALKEAEEYQFPNDLSDLANQLEDLEAKATNLNQHLDEIVEKGQEMIDAGSDYFSNPEDIFNGLLAILKDGAIDSVKIAVATPITKGLMEKYLKVYPPGYLEGLGVVGGNAGMNYLGSSILLDFQSIEVCVTYKMRIELPFLDIFEYQLKTTAATRAWIGDGTTNENGRGVELEEKALGEPGNVLIGGDWEVDEEAPEIPSWLDMPVKNKPSQEMKDILEELGFTEEEFIALMIKPVEEYTNEEYAYMQAARDLVAQPDASTTMVKVINANDIENYINETYQIRGCVTTASAVEGNLGSYDNTVESLRLDYSYTNGSGEVVKPYPPGGNEYFYIEFKVAADDLGKLDIPTVEALGGDMTTVSYPQTGNGFLGGRNGTIIPEWNATGNLETQKETIIWRVVDGKKQKYAVYDGEKYVLQN